MIRAKVLCSIFEHGTAYGKKGDVVTVPTHIAQAFAKGGAKAKLKIIGPVEVAAPTIKKPAKKAPAVPAVKPATS